jgi:hypothetical protein
VTDITSLIEQDLGPGRRIGGWQFWHCPFHPQDDTPSLAVRNGRYYCFACRATGDAVDWLVKYRHLPMGEALRQVKGNGHAPPKQDDIPPIVTPDEVWQQQAIAETIQALDRLLNEPEGYAARDYLTKRGLCSETWTAWALGAGYAYNPLTERKERAIVIPHFDGQGQVLAIKYRFLSGSLRYISRRGSKATIYGLWQPAKPVLLIVEGELNACSIWQVAGDELTVVSPGSESGGKAPLVQLLKSPTFQRKIVWFDRPELAGQYAPLADQALVSPVVDGVKLDANRMLQEGILGDFIKRVLEA